MDPLKKQLRDGMLTYVPVKFEKPEGVGRAALVTQAQVGGRRLERRQGGSRWQAAGRAYAFWGGVVVSAAAACVVWISTANPVQPLLLTHLTFRTQPASAPERACPPRVSTQALSEARHEYDAVKPRRPASAPLRRYMSIGAATGASSSMRAIAAAAALAEAGDFGGAGGAGRGGGGGGLGGGLGMGEDKWGDVPLVRVQVRWGGVFGKAGVPAADYKSNMA